MISTLPSKLKFQALELDRQPGFGLPWSGLSSPTFMQSPAWLTHAWSKFHRWQPGVEPNDLRGIALCDAENEIVGGALWFRQTSGATRWWRLVGSGRLCSDYAQMPCKLGWEEEVGKHCAEWMDSQPRKTLGLPEAIEVDGYSPDCPQWQAFFDKLCSLGWSLDNLDIEGTWRMQLPDSWQEYESSLNKSHRRKARRAWKTLESGEATHSAYRTIPEIEQWWPTFVALHQKRRQYLGQEGCFADSHFEQFLKSAVLELAAKDAVWISCVSVATQPIAMLLIFDWQGTSYLYQSGIDTDRLDHEPGHLVNAATIHVCIESGQQCFDFLRGDERYKSDWRATRNRLCRTIAFPPGFTGRSIASARKLRRNVLNWVTNKNTDTTSEKS